MKRFVEGAECLAALTFVVTAASAQTLDKPSLSLEGARKVIAAAKAEASAKNASGAVIAGVSGAASAQQDEELAIAGAAALSAPSSAPTATSGTLPDSATVVYLPAGKVTAGFAKGTPLLETGTYKVHASRRERDGHAEVHTRDTDILYVLDGTATLVTGGQVVNGQTIATDELRGDSISGGETRPLVKGDVVIVPNGVPHLFKDVKAPFLYYVVKVTAAKGLS